MVKTVKTVKAMLAATGAKPAQAGRLPGAPTKAVRKAAASVAGPRTAPRAPDGSATRSWLSVVRAYNLCDALLARRLGALGVRTAEHEILANLRREPGLSQQALAARCFTAKSHISALLTSLEERGWLRRERDPADARAKRLFLEPAGVRVAERTAQAQSEVIAVMATAVTAEELAGVMAAMQAVSEALQAELDGPQ